MEAIQLPTDLLNKMDAFQLKGIRQILKITTTYIDRSHTNAFVIKKANEALSSVQRKPGQKKSKAYKKVRKVAIFSKYVKQRACKFMAHVIRADTQDPIRVVTLQRSKIKPRLPSKRRVGRPG